MSCEENVRKVLHGIGDNLLRDCFVFHLCVTFTEHDFF